MHSWISIHLMVLAGILFLLPAVSDAGPLESHPLSEQFKVLFAADAGKDFASSGITRSDYLKLIAGNVDFFKSCQDKDGAIIDPVSKGERQYSTPAFAAAAGLLVKEAGRADLLAPATRAMTFSLTALVNKRAADGHADFYIPILIHAFRSLKDLVTPEQRKQWEAIFAQIDPESTYNEKLRGMNWNIVSSSGELLRRKDGLVAGNKMKAQMDYLEKCLDGHMKSITPTGLFNDPGAPMAYDAFSRLWLEDLMANDAYSGRNAAKIESALRLGGLSTLLLLSPSGEWVAGGRSGLHNWNEAEIAVICEINANYWKKNARPEIAGAFKRAAHLAFASMQRWQRPSGELWIIKNRAEPPTRLAYEGYSNHSQYNLLPMAMLAMAFVHGDESIAEKPMPSEVGGYVFDVRETFHKVVAAAGGYFLEIDTAGDPHYESTGLLRVHRAGVAFPALSDSCAPDSAYAPKTSPKSAVALGIQWKKDDSSEWTGLADWTREKPGSKGATVQLNVLAQNAADTVFELKYALGEKETASPAVVERYHISRSGVEQASTLVGEVAAVRAQLPVLVSDGAEDTKVRIADTAVAVSVRGSTTQVEFASTDVKDKVQLLEPRYINHNGYVQRAVVELRGKSVTTKVSLKQD